MPKFSANLTMLFNEVDFLDRFAKAATAGFKGVEYLFPYAWEKEQLVERLDAHGLIQVLHNLPAGDWSKGERGIACLPGRETEFQEGVGKAIEYAKALNCSQVNCLVGLTPAGVPTEKVRKTLIANLHFAAVALEKEGIRLLIEALNDKDFPGFHLVRTADVLGLIKEIGFPNVYLQYDVYHMQVMEGNLIKTIRANIDKIAHIQIADNPGRNEPGTGEINFPNIFKAIDADGYKGWIGCEYKPAGKTEDGFGWMKPFSGCCRD
jgi:hydroxypyruvate isomerase